MTQLTYYKDSIQHSQHNTKQADMKHNIPEIRRTYYGWEWADEETKTRLLPCTHLVSEFYRQEFSIDFPPILMNEFNPALFDTLIRGKTPHEEMQNWVLLNEYTPQLGDIVILRDGETLGVHTGIYIPATTPDGIDYILHAVRKVGAVLHKMRALPLLGWNIVDVYRHKDLIGSQYKDSL